MHFTASDGVELEGWYRPSRNGASVLMVSGGGGNRRSTLRHAKMLERNGYGVLVYDPRGAGHSEGTINSYGWGWDKDVDAAIGFLKSRPDVEGGRVGALGLSTGADIVIDAAGRRSDLHAVVADGSAAIGYEDIKEFTDDTLTRAADVAAVQDDRGDPGPLGPAGLARRPDREAPRTPNLLISANKAEKEWGELYDKAGGSRSELWYLPKAGHTAALKQYPDRVRAAGDRLLRAVPGRLPLEGRDLTSTTSTGSIPTASIVMTVAPRWRSPVLAAGTAEKPRRIHDPRRFSLSSTVLLIGVLAVLLVIDLAVMRGRTMSLRTAAIASAVWVGVAIAFFAVLLGTGSGDDASNFLAGYLVEKSLSLDNVFVFLLVFSAFAVSEGERHRLLTYGIVIALVLRGLFIVVGAAALSAFGWVSFVFAAFLIWTGWKLFRHRHDHDGEKALVEKVRRRLPFSPGGRRSAASPWSTSCSRSTRSRRSSRSRTTRSSCSRPTRSRCSACGRCSSSSPTSSSGSITSRPRWRRC